MTDPQSLYTTVRTEAATVLVGNEQVLEELTVSLLTGGHILLEGVPGVAKTTIADVFANTLGLDFQRIQMTPDLMPVDITGTKIYRETTGEFETKRGPVFANLVLVDEINRATPKTQSALLEAMQEEQVTIEGETYPLPDPFMVVATMNPIDMEGTFALPEAQRDRFQLKLTVDLPERDLEETLLERFDETPGLRPDQVQQAVSLDDIAEARTVVENVYVDESIRNYILDIVQATRDSADTAHGASPRASIHLLFASKARAAIKGREYVIPDDPKALAESVLAHRLVLSTDAELGSVDPESVVEGAVRAVTPPTYDTVRSSATVSDGGELSNDADDVERTDE
ncbi:MoxR family ATPase [Halogeometricum sp. S1BR25-6]|uniref:MoxR family ATPase n=1 Tax=Halogeometricum salsisoli TaxID=2950536 RepID=A0ABU2GHN2_9EURY|nr:MoxR family ATPase [Halogeometricum sp. S1BR25-6]MDS0300301.1 MoxR family ATPase [Halogeometricum sp. S1BR25-6]